MSDGIPMRPAEVDRARREYVESCILTQIDKINRQLHLTKFPEKFHIAGDLLFAEEVAKRFRLQGWDVGVKVNETYHYIVLDVPKPPSGGPYR